MWNSISSISLLALAAALPVPGAQAEVELSRVRR